MAETLRALRRGLQRARGFALFVAVCNSPADRDEFIKLLGDALPGVPLQKVLLGPDTLDPLDETLRQLDGEPKGPVMITGLEKAAPSAQQDHSVLHLLNMQRPEWAAKLPQPVVLWVPEFLLGFLGREAPDFLDWRSDTFHFPPLAGLDATALHAETWKGGTDARMPEKDRRERIRELQSRIATHDGSEDPVVNEANIGWLVELANHLSLLGSFDDAERMLHQALKMSEKSGYREGMLATYGNLGGIHRTRGQLDRAEEMFRKALAMSQELRHLDDVAKAYTNLGVIYLTRGDLDRAEDMHKKALQIDEQLGRLEGMAHEYSNLGNVYLTRGDLHRAEEMVKTSLEIEKKLGRLEGMARQYGNLARVYHARGNLDRAEELLKKALEIDEQLGYQEGVANHYSNLGSLYLEQGDLDRGEDMHEKALEIDRQLGRQLGMAAQYGNLGLIHLLRGDFHRAEEMLGKTQEIHRRVGARQGIAISCLNLGAVRKAQGDMDGAREYWTQARDMFVEIGIDHQARKAQDLLDRLGTAAD